MPEKPGNLIESSSEIDADIKNKLLYTNALNWLGLHKI